MKSWRCSGCERQSNPLRQPCLHKSDRRASATQNGQSKSDIPSADRCAEARIVEAIQLTPPCCARQTEDAWININGEDHKKLNGMRRRKKAGSDPIHSVKAINVLSLCNVRCASSKIARPWQLYGCKCLTKKSDNTGKCGSELMQAQRFVSLGK